MKKLIILISLLVSGCEAKTPGKVDLPDVSCIKTGRATEERFHGKQVIAANFLCDAETATLYFYDSGALYGLRSSEVHMFARSLDRSVSCELQSEAPEEFYDRVYDPRERTFYQCKNGTMMLESDEFHLLTEFIFHSRNNENLAN